MRDEDSPALAWSGGRFGSTSPWTLLVVLLGLSLWAQIFLLPLLEELRFVDQSQAATLAYLVPLVALIPGALFRISPLSLLAFPLCFVPGVILLPERSVIELEQLGSMIRVAITFAAYLGATAASMAGAESLGEVDQARDEPPERVDGIYPMYFLVRGAILLALLVITQYAAFHDPAIAETIAEHYAQRPEGARAFIGLFIFFAWCVAAYTMFFVPLMNLEYDVRRLSRTIDETVDRGHKAHWIRIGAWMAVAVVVVGILMAIG